MPDNTQVRDAPPQSLPLTGERTVPGIPEENYWFLASRTLYDLQ